MAGRGLTNLLYKAYYTFKFYKFQRVTFLTNNSLRTFDTMRKLE